MVNDQRAFRVDWMPFARHRTSRLGTGGIPFSMADMTENKLNVLKSDSLRAAIERARGKCNK